MIETPKERLQSVFGYREFRPLQEDIITCILEKRDTLVVMPTGGGKSLCYQLPALAFPGLTIVVSPLISLMKDQVEQLRALGVAAAFLNSSLEPGQYGELMRALPANQIKLLYISPEALLRPHTLAFLASCQVDSVTIDEAHCISEWGHDFRPEYRQLVKLREPFPNAVFSAFTATATPRVQRDIQQSLQFGDGNAFVASFDRDNLFLEVADKVEPYSQLLDFLQSRQDQSGIIYCFSRNQVDQVAQTLKMDGYSVLPYHAGLQAEERTRNQEAFGRDDALIIVATIAFGMGINKPNVRFVVHYDMPKNVESYYQQIGRAGRDGLPGHCLLLFGYGDLNKIRFLISGMSDENERMIAESHLEALIHYAQHAGCRRVPLLKHFGEDYHKSDCEQCDNCKADPDRFVDVTVQAQKFLSCVARTGQSFGAAHVIDVLRGSKSKKVLQFQHTQLSTYGIGSEYSKKQWLALSRQFIQNGLIVQGEYGSLKLTAKANPVLLGEMKIDGILVQEKRAVGKFSTVPQEYREDLFAELRVLRKSLADNMNVPPYVIFPDKTLYDMAAFLPRSRESLLQMHGVGEVKLKQYGHHFMQAITRYCDQNGIAGPGSQGSSRGPQRSAGTIGKHRIVGEAFSQGATMTELQARFNIKTATILQHLLAHVREGHPVPTATLWPLAEVSEQARTRALHCFEKFGAEFLKPTYDALSQQIDYPRLRVLQLCYLAEELEKKTTPE